MKPLLILTIITLLSFTTAAQAKGDTTKPKYLRFYTIRIDTTEYQRSIDTLVIGKGYIGRNLFHEDALFWQDAMIRALQRIDNRVQRDSVKIQGGNK